MLGQLFDVQSEGDIIKHVQVRKQRIFLEYGIDPALIRRDGGQVLSVHDYLAGGRHAEAGNEPEHRGLSASGGSQQRQEFTITNIKVDIVKRNISVEILADSNQLNQAFTFHNQ